MSEERDYYSVLGLTREADAAEIKAAYRKAAVRWHPDRNPGDSEAEARFKEASEAYSVLSDPQRRAQYDRFGRRAGGGTGFGGFDPETFGDFADILGQFFGAGFGDLFGGRARRGARVRPGADLRYELALTLEEAFAGSTQTLRIPRLETCTDCEGSGAAPGSRPAACPACRGAGQVRYSQGFLSVARTCPQCGGDGQIVEDPCPGCQGKGRVERERSLDVEIPPGVDTGNRLRVGGEGEHGVGGGPAGDLYVDLVVLPHEQFSREGADVHGSLDLHYAEAVLGARFEVPTLHGIEDVEVPPGTASGTRLRLRGKGMPRLGRRRGHGDHLVEVRIAVPHPRDLSAEQVGTLQRLAELEGRGEKLERGVLERVRDLFG